MRGTSYALDKYTVAGNANNNNADIWTSKDPTNQNIVFESVSGNTVKIKLSSSGLYLTAYNNANGTSSGKTPTSAGNVFWAANKSSTLQQWTFKEVGGSSGGGSGNGVLTVGSRPSTLNYNGGCYNRFAAGQCTWHACGRALEVTGKAIQFSATSDLHAKNWWKYVLTVPSHRPLCPTLLPYGTMAAHMATLAMLRKYPEARSISQKPTGIPPTMRLILKMER